MSVLAAAIEAAKRIAKPSEGWRARKYLCPAGVWTQGWGHTGKGITSTPWSLEHGETVLDGDMAIYARAVLALSPNLARLPPPVLGALADFAFNLGTTAYKASTLRRRVAAEDWEGAAVQLKRWVFGGGRKLPGLVKRRALEAAMILQAVSANDNARGPAFDRDRLRAEVTRILETSNDPRADLLKLLEGAPAPAAKRAA